MYICVCMHLINSIIALTGGAWDDNGYATMKPKNLISSILGGTPGKPKPIAISNPHDFRQVSALLFLILVLITLFNSLII